ncbi:MAG: FtsX-like permease family protein [Chloroflexi bacterium]|nr:FtsX-like permease family protein [Chloroflexota bacterium]
MRTKRGRWMLINPRWRKVMRDLWLNKVRTFLVVLAIAIGIFGIGVVVNAYSILIREMDKNYLNTNPASATLWTDPMDRDFVQAVQDLSVIDQAEARRKVVGRIQVGPDEWKDIWLFVINDFDNVCISTFVPEDGVWPPADGEILLEREALSVARADVGDTVFVRIPDGLKQDLSLVGTVHAPGLAPAWMEGFAYGFVTPGTLELLGGEPYLNELKIVVAENEFDKETIKETAYQLKGWIEQNGRQVYRIEIPEPGKHPHITQMSALLFLLQAFGLLALVLSGVLVANMISALLAQQIRQIGMMKAVGARNRQIVGIYFGIVLALGLVALVVAMPAGVWVGRLYADFAADMLNFDIFSTEIPVWVYVLQVLVGLLVPILVAAYPIYKGSRVTVRQALSDYGVGQSGFGKSPIDVLLGRIRGVARPFLLSLRNTFRRRGRLVLTLGTLAVGGAVFIVAMNVAASMDNTVSKRFDPLRYDIQLRFNRSYRVERIEQVVGDTSDVVQVETWGGAKAARVYPDGTTGNNFTVVAPPATTELMAEIPVIEGRWLRPDDGNGVVVNNQLLEKEPDVNVGDEITLRIGDRETGWLVVGVAQELIAVPTAFVNNEYFSQVTDQVGYAQNAVVVAESRDMETVSAIARSLEQSLQDAGLDVGTTQKMGDFRQAVEDHLKIIAFFLVLMSVLVVIVGGLGLISTMSINVLERTREIGVMRAIGASDWAILRIIVVEGGLIGALSWIIAVLLSLPLSVFVSRTFGVIFFETPLAFAVSPMGLVIWFVIVVVFSGLASFYPAWNATWLTTREVLAYE